jgi:hypothetical protein
MANELEPIPFIWDGEECVMRPARGYRPLARRQFVHGEEYPLEVHEQRSMKSLRHYHAAIRNAWQNLRDEQRYKVDPTSGEIDDKYPEPDSLRKWALIKLGYRKERFITCDTEEQALALVPKIQPIDEEAIIVVSGNVIKIYTARSQSMYGRNRMTKEEFQRSKTEVLDLLAEHIGVSRTVLEKQGEPA